MKDKIHIIDYGMGNLWSVLSALRNVDLDCVVTSNPRDLGSAKALVLPGVGSYKNAMASLKISGLLDAINNHVLERQRAILGICLGMQVLSTNGTEDGISNGFGFMPGTVEPFPDSGNLKIPHIGFNSVQIGSNSKLLNGLPDFTDFYFVHSFRLKGIPNQGISSLASYGEPFVAAWEHENIMGAQFHPEKSQSNGLIVLKNFGKLI